MPPKEKNSLLSVIVPIYGKGETVERDLVGIENVLKERHFNYEIICVDDGMIDKSVENAKKVKSDKIKIYSYKENRGKGYSVRYGMARAKGDLIAFIDAGADIDPSGIPMVMEHMKWYDADIIVGSKRHPASEVYYPLPRKLLSFSTQLVVLLLFGLKVKDTQVGLKIFKRKVLEKVLPRLLLKRFAFDIEILAVAKRLGFSKIYEAPVKLSHHFSSTVKIFGSNGIWCSFRDTLAIFYRLNILHYYDDSAKRKWVYDKNLDMRINV